MQANKLPQSAAFPTELTDRPQWLVWRYINKPGQKKPAKMPYYATTGHLRGWPFGKPGDGVATPEQPQEEQGSELDRQHLVAFDDAMAFARARRFDGVGFAFLPGDGLIGIDLDATLPLERMHAIREACGTFCEASPSGTGLHIIGLGDCETFKFNPLGLEVFCGRQFFTMTGHHDQASPFDVRPIPPRVLEDLRAEVDAAKKAAKDAKAPAQAPALPVAQRPIQAASSEAMRYCLHALHSAVQRISGCVEGGRNDALNQEAYGLGQLLHHGVISETTVRAELAAAAAACGLPPGEAAATISSGLRGGQDKPRPIPARHTPMRQQAPEPAPQHIDPDTGEILDAAPPPSAPMQAANDNTPAALSQFCAVMGLAHDGKYWLRDLRTGQARGYSQSELMRKSTLLALAEPAAWMAAAGCTRFNVDDVFAWLVAQAKSMPALVQERREQTGNGQQLTGMHAADSALIAHSLRTVTLYDEYSTTWYEWDTIWRPTTEGDVKRRVLDVLDDSFALQYNSDLFNGTFTLLKTRLGRAPIMSRNGEASFDAWNRNRALLPMRNGVLDMETGTLLEHSPEMMMPWMIPHDHDPEAECPTVERFILELSQGDTATENVLHAFMAAVLHGRADLQRFLECVGIAGTGKSTYLKLCQSLVGDANVAVTTMKQLNENKFETANLYGKRLVVITDADKYGGSVDTFKSITGQDPVRYEEKMKQAGKPFIYGGMVIVAANQPIQFSDTSTAMVRRRVPVHMDKRLDPAKSDPHLQEKLEREIPGLINLLLRMSQDEITEILTDKRHLRAHDSNRAMCETNPIAAWINDMVVVNPGAMAKVGSQRQHASRCLYPNYVKYCDVTGRKGAASLQNFSRAVLDVLSSVKIEAEKRSTNEGIHITGIRLRTDMDDLLPAPLLGGLPDNYQTFE